MPVVTNSLILAFWSFEHLVNPVMLAADMASATTGTRAYESFSLTKSKRRRPDQQAGARYRAVQKTFLSAAVWEAEFGEDSKTQVVEPSSRTLLHQRRPTRRLPDTFFTTQKSAERRRTDRTKVKTKFEVMKEEKR
jgi:hypothetical protein